MMRNSLIWSRRLAIWVLLCLCCMGACKGSASEQLSRAERGRIQELKASAQKLEESFRVMLTGLASAKPSECPAGAIREAIARSQNRTVPFADALSLERAAAGKAVDGSQPLARLISKVLVERRPSGEAKDQKTATDAAFDAMALNKAHDFLAVLAYQLTRPEADAQGFHGGKLEGKLGLFELSSGELLCVAPVFVQSDEEIAGKPGQSPQQAVDEHFDLQIRRALQEALTGLTPELNLDMR